jgi:hypothetical protein
MQPENTIERKTVALWASAYALTRGVRLIRVERGQTHKAVIVLDDTEGQATEALEVWWCATPMVNGRSLIAARSVLLDEITNVQQRGA